MSRIANPVTEVGPVRASPPIKMDKLFFIVLDVPADTPVTSPPVPDQLDVEGFNTPLVYPVYPASWMVAPVDVGSTALVVSATQSVVGCVNGCARNTLSRVLFCRYVDIPVAEASKVLQSKINKVQPKIVRFNMGFLP